MVDSKTKKTTPTASTAKKTAAKTQAASKKANKPVTKSKAVANNKATTKTSSTTNTATDSKKPTSAKPPVATKTSPSKKEKRSGNGMAFLALLCSLGALGLSGYNYYLQNLSPQNKQSQDSLLIGVNEIKSNVTEFGTVITSVRKEVQDFKASQEKYITEDTLAAEVKKGVDNAVQNLPELPNIGPKPLGPDAEVQNNSPSDGQISDVKADGSRLEAQDNSTVILQDGAGTTNFGASATIDTENTANDSEKAVNDSEKAANEQVEDDDSFWSWGRAKQDMKDMLKSLIKIEKTEQN